MQYDPESGHSKSSEPKPSKSGSSTFLACTSCTLFSSCLTLIAGISAVVGILALLRHQKAMEHISPLSPPLPGILVGMTRPKIILAQDIDYPPYAYLGVPPESDYDVAGIGHDIAHGLKEVCDIDIFTVQTKWSRCWDAGSIGDGLGAGEYHGCMTYTHTAGERNRFLEFSKPILQMNKPAGLLTRLNVDGTPLINGLSDLSGKKVVDVTGWAPTADTLALVENKCTKKRFSGYTMIQPEVAKGQNPNDVALAKLLDGTADAVWIYADQAHHYKCTDASLTPEWDCNLWSGFGSKFAYVQTGLFGHAHAGTTLTMSKKGSGVPDIVNPCLEKFKATKSYYKICETHNSTEACFPNAYFPTGSDKFKVWEVATDKLTTTCKDGYCPCPAQ